MTTITTLKISNDAKTVLDTLQQAACDQGFENGSWEAQSVEHAYKAANALLDAGQLTDEMIRLADEVGTLQGQLNRSRLELSEEIYDTQVKEN